jgi:hypothetical protein
MIFVLSPTWDIRAQISLMESKIRFFLAVEMRAGVVAGRSPATGSL